MIDVGTLPPRGGCPPGWQPQDVALFYDNEKLGCRDAAKPFFGVYSIDWLTYFSNMLRLMVRVVEYR